MSSISNKALLALLSESALDQLKDAVAEELDGAMYCTRCWSAWSVGTMSANDFVPANEEDVVEDMVILILKALAQNE